MIPGCTRCQLHTNLDFGWKYFARFSRLRSSLTNEVKNYKDSLLNYRMQALFINRVHFLDTEYADVSVNFYLAPHSWKRPLINSHHYEKPLVGGILK